MGSNSAQYPLTGRWVRSRKITYADKNTTKQVIDVPAGTFIPPFGVSIIVTTPFSGGSPSLDAGDGDNADGWVDTGDVTEGTAGAYSGTETNTAAYAASGKYYSAADTIDVVVADGATAGEAYVMAYMVNVADIIDD
jgi:hypothetical protein